MTANPETGAVEVTDVDSAALALQQRYAAHDTPEPEETDDVEPVDSSEELDDGEADEVEPDEVEEESDEQEPDAEDEAPQFQTLEELAEAVDMPLDEFLATIKGKVKIDGEETEITLAEMRDGQQRETDYRRKTMELSEQRKAFEEQQSQAQSRIENDLRVLGQTMQLTQQELSNEFNSIDWNKLQAENPAEWSLKRQQFGERQARINQSIQTATQQAQAFSEQQKSQADQKQSEYVEAQNELLLTAIPEWKDTETRQKGSLEVGEYFLSQGFDQDEVANITDHRIILMAREAMNAKKVSSDVDLAKKKVKKVPKLVKANARKSINQGKQATVTKLTKRVKSSGDVNDLAALLNARRS